MHTVGEQIKKLRNDAKAGFDPTSPTMTADPSGKASAAKCASPKVTIIMETATIPKRREEVRLA